MLLFIHHQVASAFLNLGLALDQIPGYSAKAAEAKGIAARLNPDFADIEAETGVVAALVYFPSQICAVMSSPENSEHSPAVDSRRSQPRVRSIYPSSVDRAATR